MTVALLETLTADLLENKNLVSLGIIINNSSLDYCTLYVWSTNLHSCIICNEEDLGELYVCTFGISEPLHKDFVASFNFELLASDFYDSVHIIKPVKVSTVSGRQ